MPTLNLQGLGSVTVGPEFLKLSPEEQSRTVDEIAVHIKGANGRIAGAFDAAGSVRQVDKLSAPYNGLMVSQDRLGDIHPGSIPQNVMQGVMNMPKDIAGAVQTVGDVAAGRTNAMVPDTGQGVTNPVVENAAKTLAPFAMPLTPGLRAGEGWAAAQTGRGFRRELPAVPTAEELRAAGSAGYDQARAMGVDYHPQAVAQMASTLRAELEQDGINPIVAPKSFKLLQMLEQPPPGAGASLGGLDTARKAFRLAARDFSNPTEQLAATKIIQQLDRFTENPDAASVVAGPAAAAGAVQKDARGNYAAAMRSRTFAGKQDQATLHAGASNSGANLDNALRQRVRDVLKSDKASAGYSDEELAAMRRFVIGDKSRNTLRKIANAFGGGGGLGTMATAAAGFGSGGYLAGGPTGAVAGVALPVLGWGAKKAENMLAKKGMGQIDEQLRMRSPLYNQRAANAPVNPVSPAMRALLMRGSLLYGPNAQQGGGGY